MSLRDVKHISFPAVTVCYPNPGKWIGIVKVLDHFDSAALIFDVIKNQPVVIQDMFKAPYRAGAMETILNSFEPKLSIGHDMPTRLGFSTSETEIFYLVHLAINELLNQSWTYHKFDQFMKDDIFDLKFASLLDNKPRDMATQDIKALVCNVTGMDCTFTNDKAWFHCNNTSVLEGSSMYVLHFKLPFN